MKAWGEQSTGRRRQRTIAVATTLCLVSLSLCPTASAWNVNVNTRSEPLRYRSTQQQRLLQQQYSSQFSGSSHFQQHQWKLPTSASTSTASGSRNSALTMSSMSPHISVSIDQPLITDTLFPPGTRVRQMRPIILLKSLLSLLTMDVVRVAIVAFSLALLFSIAFRSSNTFTTAVQTSWKLVNGQIQRVLDKFRPTEQGIPMPFDDANTDKQGWGVCTLRSKRRLGKSSFVQYDFDLPEPDYVLPLDLGQTISLCCLDNDNSVAKGDFFVYNGNNESNSKNGAPKPGQFTILAPNRSPDANEFAVGQDAANFVRVLKQDMKVGDEIALRPGHRRLAYRGQYLPVTDMVYIAIGAGVVPVLDQVRAVLPNGSSSVKSVTVVWINEAAKDFDVTAELLEKEYFKYSTKLAVSCVVDDLQLHAIEDNVEINGVVPNFIQGTMAVLAGPEAMTKKAAAYLEERGYPEDTICIM